MLAMPLLRCDLHGRCAGLPRKQRPHRVSAHKQRVPGGAGSCVGTACGLPLRLEAAPDLQACAVSALTSHKRPGAYCSGLEAVLIEAASPCAKAGTTTAVLLVTFR